MPDGCNSIYLYDMLWCKVTEYDFISESAVEAWTRKQSQEKHVGCRSYSLYKWYTNQFTDRERGETDNVNNMINATLTLLDQEL